MPNFSVYGMILQTRILACMCVCVCDKSLQSCPTLCDPMDCGMPSSFVHRDSPGKNTGVGCHALLQGNLPDPEIEPGSPALWVDSLPS